MSLKIIRNSNGRKSVLLKCNDNDYGKGNILAFFPGPFYPMVDAYFSHEIQVVPYNKKQLLFFSFIWYCYFHPSIYLKIRRKTVLKFYNPKNPVTPVNIQTFLIEMPEWWSCIVQQEDGRLRDKYFSLLRTTWLKATIP